MVMFGLSPKQTFIALILIGTFLEVCGDILFKKWSIEGKNILLMVGLLVYFAGAVPWALSLQYAEVSEAIVVFMVLNVIGVVLAGMVLFHETITDIQKVGIGLGILSIVLLEWPE
jgi:multidrug transporter EmrE-like cation transporter